jgi:Uma2 family endonuclease
MTDMKLRVGEVYYYPDVMVCCESPIADNPTERHDPCALIEVLSPGTASIDRREKLLVYREIPWLRTYLIVDQDTRRVERHFRGEDGIWQRAEHVTDGGVPIPCLETLLSLADIYQDL